MPGALGTVHVHMSVYPILMGACRLAAEVYPLVGTVELEVERAAVGLEWLSMAAPAVDEPMRSGADPLVIVHIVQDRAAGWVRQCWRYQIKNCTPERVRLRLLAPA